MSVRNCHEKTSTCKTVRFVTRNWEKNIQTLQVLRVIYNNCIICKYKKTNE